MTLTPNIELEKYDPDDIFSFNSYNTSMDKVDEAVHENITRRFDVSLGTSSWTQSNTWWRQATTIRIGDGDVVEITNIDPFTLVQLSELGIQLIAENNSGVVSILAIGEAQPNLIINLTVLTYKVVVNE